MNIYCKDCKHYRYKVGMHGEPRGGDCFAEGLMEVETHPVQGKWFNPNFKPQITNAKFDCKHFEEYIAPLSWRKRFFKWILNIGGRLT